MLKIATVRPFLFSIGIGLCTDKIVNALPHSSSESQNLCRWQVLCKLDDKLSYPLMIVEVQYFSSKVGFKQVSKVNFPQFPSKSSFKKFVVCILGIQIRKSKIDFIKNR